MATIMPVVKNTRKFVTEVEWTGNSTDTLSPYVFRGVVPLDVSCQVVGGTLDVYGSMKEDGSNPDVLKDDQGSSLLAIADGVISTIATRVSTINPSLVTGTGASVVIVIRR